MKKLSAFLAGVSLGSLTLLAGCNGSKDGPNGAAYQQAVTGYNPNAVPAATGAGGTANPSGLKGGTKTGSGGTTGTGGGTTPGSTAGGGAGASNWLYVADSNDTITTFKVDPATGAISGAADTALPTGFGPMGMAVDPTGSILFVTGVGGQTPAGQLLPIAISNGTLTVGTPAKTASPLPFGVCVDPASESVFTADFNAATTAGQQPPPGTCSGFTYAPSSGALTPGNPASQTLLSNPAAVCMDPKGSYIFAALAGGAVQIINVTGGQMQASAQPQGLNLTPAHQCNAILLVGATLVVGNVDDTLSCFDLSSQTQTQTDVTLHTGGTAKAFVSSLAVDPSGAYVVSANGGTAGGGKGTDDVTLLSVGKSGLTVVGSSTALAGSNPSAVVFNGAGGFCYVANTGTATVDVFQVAATGLTPVTGSPFALPQGDQAPFGIAVSK